MKLGKSFFLVIIVFGLVIVHFFANSLGGHSFVAAANELVSLAEDKKWDIHEWQILAREEQGLITNQESFRQHVHMMSSDLDDWQVTDVDDSAQEWKATLTNQNPEMDVQESLTVFAYPENGQYRLSHTYKLQGSSLHTLASQQLEPLVNKRIDSFSLDQSAIYTQLKTSEDQSYLDNHQSLSHFATELLESLDAKQVEALEEESFVSFSAYLEDWEQAILTNGEEMNLQLAIRQEQGLGSRTTVTIGTPIITTEY
ncbi:YwmB family TATA-box binding protein [Alkalihalobacillus sp. 1P02AB]|uniref:YwmB family TATA-box binding protein n=1 Tax=Alkalihalobacillus sp. 1P02AB TaxID=3132260 RepID=UPI0039A6ACD7